ncbi:uncharacterized protein [Diabrotica undecimpunctata]|uniref:uncharacterized protein isoform X3 n=1 Tax=Diabrotica undecimpunctata TaxID=50387 RepID=UPI003B63F9A1
MESKIEIKEESVECDQIHVESQLATSSDHEDLKNGLESTSGTANNKNYYTVKEDIKEEFVKSDPVYIESQVTTTFDLRDLNKEGGGRVKVKIKEEFIEGDPRYTDIESQLSTSIDLGVLKNECTLGLLEGKDTLEIMETMGKSSITLASGSYFRNLHGTRPKG